MGSYRLGSCGRAFMPLAIVLSGACAVPDDSPELGTIHFPTSGSAAAQQHFSRGVLYLHSFEYGDAADAFRAAQEVEPDFAMAYWGEAMTYNHPVWNEQNISAAREALERLGSNAEQRRAKAPTDREKAYLAAVEILYGEGSKEQRDTLYSHAMGRISSSYPDDHEAKSFYALSLLGLSQGDRMVATYMRAGAIAQEVFDENRNHPGAAHYLIHSFDDPTHAPLGLTAARAYSRIAPGAAHAQHMTSHIFVAMGMWNDVTTANVQAASVVNTNLESDGAPPYSCGHYNEWLEYAYLQEGRFNDAVKLVNDCFADTKRSDIARSPRASYAYIRALNIVDTQNWNGDVAHATLDGDDPRTRFLMSFGDGYAAAQRGDLISAKNALKVMQSLLVSQAVADGTNEIMHGLVQALISHKEGNTTRALQQLGNLAALEESLPFAFGPPGMAKPPRELLADLLLETGRPGDAMMEYAEAISRTPRRAQTLLGLARAADAVGRSDIASDSYAALRDMWKGADPDLAALSEVNRFGSTPAGASQ